MSRRIAFLWGSNANKHYPSLRYARRDVERLRGTLSSNRYGFEVVTPPAGSNPHQIHEAILDATSSCTPDDVFIGYFSGHGQLIGSKLYFVLDKSVPSEARTMFSSAWLIEAFHGCQARNRLLILDCCHAGAATGVKGSGVDVTALFPEHRDAQVLFASGRLEAARELRELEGSFLTHTLCRSLVAAPPGSVTLSRVMDALQGAAAAHNRQAPLEHRVPVPHLSGLHQGDFHFTSIAEARDPSHPKIMIDTPSWPPRRARGGVVARAASAIRMGLRAAASDGHGAYLFAMLVFGLAAFFFHYSLQARNRVLDDLGSATTSLDLKMALAEASSLRTPDYASLSLCAICMIAGVSVLVLSFRRKLRRQQSLLARGLPHGVLELSDGKIARANDRAEEILRTKLPRLGIHSARVESGKTFAPMIRDRCVLLPSHDGPPSKAELCSYDGKLRDRAADGLTSVFYAWVIHAEAWIKVTSTVILLPGGTEHVFCTLDTAIDRAHEGLLAAASTEFNTQDGE